jgi:hypothetical protein
MYMKLRPKPPSASHPKFHFFPKLPVELRLKIWKLATSSRMIHIKLQHQDGKLHWTAKASCSLNSLSVNREARSEALRQYDQSFNKDLMAPLLIRKTDRRLESLHVNWVHDLVYIDIPESLEDAYILWQQKHNFERLFHSVFTTGAVSEGRIRKLAINGTTLTRGYIGAKSNGSGKANKWEVEVFKQVQEIVIVVTKRFGGQSSLPFVAKDEKTGSSWKEKVEAKFAEIKKRRPDWKGPTITITSKRQLPMRKIGKKRKA